MIAPDRLLRAVSPVPEMFSIQAPRGDLCGQGNQTWMRVGDLRGGYGSFMDGCGGGR